MSKRKRKGKLSDFSDIFDFGLNEGKPFEQAPGSSGYSISVSQDEKGKPVVKVKTYGDIDSAELRKDIEKQYSGAKIEGLENKPLIRIVDEETEEDKRQSDEKRRKVHKH